eukprot:5637197-Amphidinium_carterae.2
MPRTIAGDDPAGCSRWLRHLIWASMSRPNSLFRSLLFMNPSWQLKQGGHQEQPKKRRSNDII